MFVGEEEAEDDDDCELDIRKEGEVYESILVVDTKATGADILFLIDFRFELPTLDCELFFVRVRRNDIVLIGRCGDWRLFVVGLPEPTCSSPTSNVSCEVRVFGVQAGKRRYQRRQRNLNRRTRSVCLSEHRRG